jgi:hypothetical protein
VGGLGLRSSCVGGQLSSLSCVVLSILLILSMLSSGGSHLVPSHLIHFRKFGLFVGEALVEGWNLEFNFTWSFLKHLLGSSLYVDDL